MKCIKCSKDVVKNGKQVNGKQRYYCKNCKLSFQDDYTYKAYKKTTDKHIYLLLKESVGITSTARLLGISKTTVLTKIKYMASKVKQPVVNEQHQYYELDEMRAVVNYKLNEAWITYAINRHTKQIVNFVVGNRTKDNLSIITKQVLSLQPKKVFTDGLPAYKSIIPSQLHNTRKKNTTVIERHNLTLRTHLKRLSRKTICYSKNFEMLESVLKIYFWGDTLVFD